MFLEDAAPILSFEPYPTLETDRLVLRQFKIEDADSLYTLRTDDTVMKYLGKNKMKSRTEALVYINKSRKIKNGDACIEWALTVKEEDLLIGKLGFWRIVIQHHRAELGYSMLPAYYGKGYMSEAVKAVLKYGFEKMQLHSVEANLNPNNQKSEALLKRNGFIKEGHYKENFYYKGIFSDTVSYSLLRNNWEK